MPRRHGGKAARKEANTQTLALPGGPAVHARVFGAYSAVAGGAKAKEPTDCPS
jgi:hypothetical protein